MKKSYIFITLLLLINFPKSWCQQNKYTCAIRDGIVYYEYGIRFNFINKLEASNLDSIICNTTKKKFILDGLVINEKLYLTLNLNKKQIFMERNFISFNDHNDDPSFYHNCMMMAYFYVNTRGSIYLNGKRIKKKDSWKVLSPIKESEIVSIKNIQPLFYFAGCNGKIKIITK